MPSAAPAPAGAASGAAAAALKAELRRHGRDPDAAVDEGTLVDLLCDVDPVISRGEVETLFAHVQKISPEHLTLAKFVDFIFSASPEHQQDSRADGGLGDPSSSLGPASSQPAADPPRQEPGATVLRIVESGDSKYEAWKASVGVPERYQKRRSTVQDTAERGISLEQLEMLGSFVKEVVEHEQIVKTRSITDRDGELPTWFTVNLYIICDYFVKPLSKVFPCSFMELVATSIQVPAWFISHWWGTPFRESLRMLRLHFQQRGLSAGAYYWLCTFANNQHDLSELTGGLEGTPFMRVLRSRACKGTVVLMDSEATPFRRVWCVLECHESAVQKLSYDLAAWIPEGTLRRGDEDVPPQAAVQLDEGDGRVREVTESGSIFPPTVAATGVGTDIVKAEASVQADYDAIIDHIKGSTAALNRAVRERFAAGAMYDAARLGDAPRLRGLLGDFPESKDTASAKGLTPSIIAAHKGHAELLKALAKAGADLNKASQKGSTPAVMASQSGHVQTLKVLVEAGADLNKTQNTGATPTFIAAEKGFTEALKVLVQASADLDKTNQQGCTPAMMAAMHGHAGVLRVLVEARADLHKAPQATWTPAALAKKHGRTEVLAVLMAAGVVE